jgi:hypothetical protein
MKHIFTFLAALSLLICLFFVVVTVATFNSSWEVPLGHTEGPDGRTKSFDAKYGELVYNDELNDFGRQGLTKTTDTHFGYEIRKQTKPADPRHGTAESTSYQYSFSPAIPIIVFAILPLGWLVAKFGGKRKPRPESGDSDPPVEPARRP